MVGSANYWLSSADTVTTVTPSDTVNLTKVARSLFINTAGTLSILTNGGSSVTLTVIAGTILPIQVSRVNATGTTATVFALN